MEDAVGMFLLFPGGIIDFKTLEAVLGGFIAESYEGIRTGMAGGKGEFHRSYPL